VWNAIFVNNEEMMQSNLNDFVIPSLWEWVGWCHSIIIDKPKAKSKI
jgi:hypothetical protein